MRRQHRPKPGTLVLRHVLAAASLAACTLPSWTAAAGPPYLDPGCIPAPEICDGLDNDCDGVIDNDNPGGATPCITGLVGACGLGTLTCVDGAMECIPELLPGHAPEICDGIDNDCDGAVDDGFDVGALCYVGIGACSGEGWRVCNAVGKTMCNAVAGEPSPETCDGIDNDCDGEVDDGNPDGGYACDTGMSGVCAIGTAFCSDGFMVCLASAIPEGQQELCDGADNDCDGQIDEGNPGGGDACESAFPGACAMGVMTCTGGLVACEPIVAPGEQREVCGDAEDSDCDGQIDNGCGAGGSGGGSPVACDDDTDCDDGSACEAGQCAPASGADDRFGDLAAYGCTCRAAPGKGLPIEWLACAAAAASVLALRARARSRKRS